MYQGDEWLVVLTYDGRGERFVGVSVSLCALLTRVITPYHTTKRRLLPAGCSFLLFLTGPVARRPYYVCVNLSLLTIGLNFISTKLP